MAIKRRWLGGWGCWWGGLGSLNGNFHFQYIVCYFSLLKILCVTVIRNKSYFKMLEKNIYPFLLRSCCRLEVWGTWASPFLSCPLSPNRGITEAQDWRHVTQWHGSAGLWHALSAFRPSRWPIRVSPASLFLLCRAAGLLPPSTVRPGSRRPSCDSETGHGWNGRSIVHQAVSGMPFCLPGQSLLLRGSLWS